MKKEEFLKIVDSLELDPEKYYIYSGGSLLIRGIREETGDVDLRVSEEYFEELKKRFTFTQGEYCDLFVLSEDVEFTVGGFNKNNSEMYEGYPIETLDAIIKWKMEHSRPKDLRDIELIKKFLEKNN